MSERESLFDARSRDGWEPAGFGIPGVRHVACGTTIDLFAPGLTNPEFTELLRERLAEHERHCVAETT